MIRFALWAHSSAMHFMFVFALAVALGFCAFIGALFLARCAWRRRRRWAAFARRAAGLDPGGAADA